MNDTVRCPECSNEVKDGYIFSPRRISWSESASADSIFSDYGNEVLVTTKPNFSTIKKIVSRFNRYHERMQFRFTITSLEDSLLKFWEPNAPLFQERMNSLKFAFNKNFRTSVSIEPFLDYYPVSTNILTALFHGL